MKHLAINVMAASLLVLAPVMAQAKSPKSFVLDCQPDTYFPTGVSGALTDRNVLMHFKEWCESAGTKTLEVSFDHEIDARVLEADGIATANASSLIDPNFEGSVRTTTTSEVVALTSNFPDAVPVGVTNSLGAYLPYLVSNSDGTAHKYVLNPAPGERPTKPIIYIEMYGIDTFCGIAAACHFNATTIESTVTTGSRSVKKVRPLNTCNPHNFYLYTNSLTGESVAFQSSGGPCYRVNKSSTAGATTTSTSTTYSGQPIQSEEN